MVKIKEIVTYLEQIAPGAYQESYDNAGLLTGNQEEEVTGVLISLDAIEEVIDEAINNNCNLVIAHHPIIFKGLKKLTGNNYVERTIIKAIKNNIAIFAIHTNLDNVFNGVNKKIAEKIELKDLQVLRPKTDKLQKLVVFVPPNNTEEVLNALSDAGAGVIGNYRNCSFQASGKGTFQPNESANPYIGTANQLEQVDEQRIEVIFPGHLRGRVLKAMEMAHPYEEVAYFLHNTENPNQEVGSGMTGTLEQPMEEKMFLEYLKEKMDLNCIKYTRLLKKQVNKVAVCGGAGGFLLPDAIKAGADIFITSDFKYHEFFDADGRIVIADIGHYESEVFTKDLLQKLLSEKFVNITYKLAKTVTNPVNYI